MAEITPLDILPLYFARSLSAFPAPDINCVDFIALGQSVYIRYMFLDFYPSSFLHFSSHFRPFSKHPQISVATRIAYIKYSPGYQT